MFEVWPLSFTLLIKPSGLACLPCKAHVLPLCLTLSSPCLRSPWLPSIVCSPVTMPTLHCVENGPKALSWGFMGDVVGGIVLWGFFFNLFVFDPCRCCVYFVFSGYILVQIRSLNNENHILWRRKRQLYTTRFLRWTDLIILNTLIMHYIIFSYIYMHFASNVTFFEKQFSLCFPLTFSSLLLAVQPCLLNTPRICMHSIVSIEYLKHFQNGKYLNRLDKQLTGGIVLGGYFA